MVERIEEVEVIHLWSSPRSVSTSLMYSFAQVRLSLYSYLFFIVCDIHICFVVKYAIDWPFFFQESCSLTHSLFSVVMACHLHSTRALEVAIVPWCRIFWNMSICTLPLPPFNFVYDVNIYWNFLNPSFLPRILVLPSAKLKLSRAESNNWTDVVNKCSWNQLGIALLWHNYN